MNNHLACALMVASTVSAAATVEDRFDWGSGVAGRAAVTNGQSIGGILSQTGGVAWVCSSGTGVFGGSEGVGNGMLAMSGANSVVYCDYAVAGKVEVAMEYVHQAFSASGIQGAWLGFTSDGRRLLNSDAYEKIYVRVQPETGKMLAGVTTLDGTDVVDNVDKNVLLGGFAAGDRLVMALAVDMDGQSAVATVSNVTRQVGKSLVFGWTEPGIGLTHLAINETAAQAIAIDSVRAESVRTAASGFSFALRGRPETLDVYVCAGQSNMAGAGEKALLPPELQAPQTNVFVFNGKDWDVMEPTATGVGPEISFAHAMHQALRKPIGIVLHAVGGTSLAVDWNPALPSNHYATLVGKVAAARQSREIHVKGMLWMQGERDCRDEAMASAYAQNLTNLVLAARADFGGDAMPFVAGRVNPPYAFTNLVRAAQESCSLPGYSYLDCDDLPKNPDNLHYNTDGQVLLGQRFALAVFGSCEP